MNVIHLLAGRDEAVLTAFELALKESGLHPNQRKQMERLLAKAIEQGDADWRRLYFDALFREAAQEKREKFDAMPI